MGGVPQKLGWLVRGHGRDDAVSIVRGSKEQGGGRKEGRRLCSWLKTYHGLMVLLSHARGWEEWEWWWWEKVYAGASCEGGRDRGRKIQRWGVMERSERARERAKGVLEVGG